MTEPGVLVIEDLRTFKFPAIYARTLAEAERLLFSRHWEEVWFDHDLGLVEGCDTVMSLVNRMEEMAHRGELLPIERIFVHTMNPAGRANIVAALSNWYLVRVVDANRYLAPGEVPMMWVGPP